jgi:hypothetical protein
MLAKAVFVGAESPVNPQTKTANFGLTLFVKHPEFPVI